MILLTGATGLVGSALLRRLLEAGEEVRCLVREPRRLGPNRVRVQITLGDLANPISIKQATRGADSVVHLAASIRDQSRASIEELNGVATLRLLRESRQAGVRRFVFFGVAGATPSSRTRFLRSKALAERAVLAADLGTVVLAPSMVYAPDDRFLALLRGLSWLPWMPVSGLGQAIFEPIWAEDVAQCAAAVALDSDRGPTRRFELAGPERMSYEEIVKVALEAMGRSRPLVNVPESLVRRGLRLLESVAGEAAFATWDEAELMEVSLKTAGGPADARRLGVEPKPMREVLGL